MDNYWPTLSEYAVAAGCCKRDALFWAKHVSAPIINGRVRPSYAYLRALRIPNGIGSIA